MTDYTDKGLDQYLNVTAGAVSSNEVSGMNFDIQNDRNIISATKLRDFSFNSGVGGTITLGGVNDQNGVLVVRNSSGGTVATIDSTGITVTNGNITIQNSGGTTILDSTGLVSSANFPFASTATTGLGTTTSTSYGYISELTLPVVTSKATNIFFIATAKGLSNGDPTDNVSRFADFSMDLGGTSIGAPMFITGNSVGSAGGYSVSFQTSTSHFIQSVVTGSTNFKLKYRTNNASYPAQYATETRISYLVLG